MAIAESLKAAVEERTKVHKQQTELVEKIEGESRAWTGEEETAYEALQESFDEWNKQVDEFEKQRQRAILLADRREELEAFGRSLDDSGRPLDLDKHGRLNRDFMETGSPNEEARELALSAFLMGGQSATVTERHRVAAEVCGVDIHSSD